MTETEGVIKFDYAFSETVIIPAVDPELLLWRQVLHHYELVGECPERYEGFGFGNISGRCDQGFLITASQTGGLPSLESTQFVLVSDWSLKRNWLKAMGALRPSSESLTHAAIYEANTEIGAVFHVHSPALWQARKVLGLPETSDRVPYGTVDMANTLKQMTESIGNEGLIAMAGHEDGIVAWSRTPLGAGTRLLEVLLALDG